MAVVESSGNSDQLASLPDLLSGDWPRERLAEAVIRTLVLELNVARVQEKLRGETPEERFRDFVNQLSDNHVQHAIWDEYPVLLRYCDDVLNNWFDSRLSFADHLTKDIRFLPELSADGLLAPVSKVVFGAGDSHRGGKTVAIVEFGNEKVVYKPRNVDMEQAWQHIVDWLARQRVTLDLVSPKVVPRGDHGWVEFITAESCTDPSEIKDFYHRIGAVLCLVYVLCGSDVHGENVIAHRGYPVMVDMEALFHGAQPESTDGHLVDPAARLVSEGVLAIGLLPTKLVVRLNGAARSFEASAIASAGEQMSLLPGAVPENSETDEMRFVHKHVPITPATENQPKLDGRLQDPTGYVDDVVAGFSATYRAILANKDDWLDADGLISMLESIPQRYIAKPTFVYGKLLFDSLHPDYLRDSIDRDRVLLMLSTIGTADHTWAPILASEIEDLRRGDIPYFETRPSSKDLIDSHGRVIKDYLSQSPADAVRERFRMLGEEDLSAQVQLTTRSFESLQIGSTATLPVMTDTLAPTAFEDEPLSRAMKKIASDLIDEALMDEGGIGWICLNFLDESFWQVGSSGIDLYSGASGIALMLEYAAEQSKSSRLAQAAEAARATIMREAVKVADNFADNAMIARSLRKHADPGLFGASGSLVYYLAHAGALSGDRTILETGYTALSALEANVRHDVVYDLIGGSAGAILAALALHEADPREAAIEVAEAAAAKLLSSAIPTGDGFAWPTPFGPQPLAGMAHGSSGIALALARLHAIRPQPGYLELIEGAIKHERGLFDEKTNNWPDLRSPEMGGGNGPLMAWCHGAPGIGLARIGLLAEPTLSELHADLQEDLRIAEATAAESIFHKDGRQLKPTGNDTLCHGTLGILSFLAMAAQHRGDTEELHRTQQAAQAIATRGMERDWLAGPVSARSLPGLMFGRAGIAWGLLTLRRPGQIPSVLLGEAPKKAHSRQHGRPSR
ncbi:hypothetical protein GCM10027598_46940 [Amycolatopsis oliviviridis]|uniref:Lantibiotic biosynthesis protein dehydration domain-containing protein n=2 Tax=Amycolatopsis oliviviridis TaxID=1471590 RepID=A0ABQ3MBF7_9PSEU|nr:hypothetical protein GCM10017790_84530 [Amycolatopsis oliviviridis]